MTVATQTAVIVVQGDGSTTSFAFPFEVPYQAGGNVPAVAVWEVVGGVYTLLVLGIDYSVSGIGAALGGFINYPLVGGALAEGDQLVIARDLDYTQSSAFTNTGFLPTSMEFAIDLMEMQTQQLAAGVAGAVRGEPGEGLRVLPSAPLRANQTLGFDSSGQPITYTPGAVTVDSATLTFALLTNAVQADIPAGTAFVQVLSQLTNGDNVVPALYVPAASGAALGKFQSADGQWWEVSPTPIGCPEWYGVQQGASSFDCTPGLLACIAAHPLTLLAGVDYWVATTLNIVDSYRTVRGIGLNSVGGGSPVSRILTASPSIDIVHVGPIAQPGFGSSFTTSVVVDSVTITRTVAPNLPPSGSDPRNGCSGLKVTFCYLCEFTDIYPYESINNVYYAGLVECYFSMIRCSRFMNASGGGSGADRYYGFFGDYTPDIGYNSGNASVYFEKLFSGLVHSSTVAVGNNAVFYMYGGVEDTYIRDCESTGHYDGIVGDIMNTANAGGDLNIDHAILDQIVGGGGIKMLNGFIAVNVTNCYITCVSGSAVEITGCTGGFTAQDCQFSGNAAAGGLVVTDSVGVTTLGCIFDGFACAQSYTGSTSCESTGDTIFAFEAPTAAGGFIQLTNTNRSVWRSKVTTTSGGMNVVGGVVVLTDGPCDYNLIDCSGIDPSNIPSGGGHLGKLTVNGNGIASAGITTGAGTGFTNNVAAGVMN